jgi:hypothetical protein
MTNCEATMIDVLYIAVFVAFFALMVAFVFWCERIVGKEDVTEVDLADDGVLATDGPDPDSTVKTPQEVTS